MRCEFGYCLICDKEIANGCLSCGTRRPTSDYTEVQLTWSNGSRMNVAVCVDCSKGPVWKADKGEITKAIWGAWDKLGSKFDKEAVLVD